jgi:hypothetical protein
MPRDRGVVVATAGLSGNLASARIGGSVSELRESCLGKSTIPGWPSSCLAFRTAASIDLAKLATPLPEDKDQPACALFADAEDLSTASAVR